MCEDVYVFVEIFEEDKVCYVEKRTFAAGSLEARRAKLTYRGMLAMARKKGFSVKEKAKSVANDDFSLAENDIVPGR